MSRIRGGMGQGRDVSDGYAFDLESQAVTLPEVAEWIAMERLSCPFLTLQVSASGHQPQWFLQLTGPEGVTPLLDREFPAPH